MANLIVVSGPQAVGKMTVAEKLKEKIGYALMTNHDSIEVSIKVFKNGSNAQKELKTLFEKTGGNFYFVELEADVKTRLERNVTPHRLEAKNSKNNMEWSNHELVETRNIA